MVAMKEDDELTRGDKISVVVLAVVLVAGLVSGIILL